MRFLIFLSCFWLLSCGTGDNTFRDDSLKALLKSEEAYRALLAKKGLAKISSDLYRQSIALGDASFSRETRDSWLKAEIDECEAEITLRSLFLPLEKQVKERYQETLPDWFRQSRDWQKIDEYLRKSNFRPPEEGCRAYYEGLGKRL